MRRAYEAALQRRGVLTKGVTSAALALVGDVAAQEIERRRSVFDLHLDRSTGHCGSADSSNFAVGGSSSSDSVCGCGGSDCSGCSAERSWNTPAVRPFGSGFWAHLDARRALAFTVHGGLWAALGLHNWFSFLERKFPGSSAYSVAGKVLAHHTICNPIAYLPVFYIFNGLIRGRNLEEIRLKAHMEYWTTLTYIWKVWVPISVIQFALVPERHLVLSTALANLGWNMMLSLLYNQRGGQ